jgi:hypothetical protein
MNVSPVRGDACCCLRREAGAYSVGAWQNVNYEELARSTDDFNGAQLKVWGRGAVKPIELNNLAPYTKRDTRKEDCDANQRRRTLHRFFANALWILRLVVIGRQSVHGRNWPPIGAGGVRGGGHAGAAAGRDGAAARGLRGGDHGGAGQEEDEPQLLRLGRRREHPSQSLRGGTGPAPAERWLGQRGGRGMCLWRKVPAGACRLGGGLPAGIHASIAKMLFVECTCGFTCPRSQIQCSLLCAQSYY